MTSQSVCTANIELGQEVHDFLVNVPNVNEESITDFLVWRWRRLDRRFHYLSVRTFSRHDEHFLTGADFHLELWLVGRKRSIPILFQAKKFIKQYDSYVRRFNYPNNTQGQLTTLQAYATARKMLSFYAIYSPNASAAIPLCQSNFRRKTGIFMLPATNAKAFGDGKFGKQLALNTILAHSNPFHCIFCCPLGLSMQYFQSYFGDHGYAVERDTENLPEHVQELLSPEGGVTLESWPDECANIGTIAVYDLREQELGA